VLKGPPKFHEGQVVKLLKGQNNEALAPGNYTIAPGNYTIKGCYACKCCWELREVPGSLVFESSLRPVSPLELLAETAE
jgi:hypothetical protein